MRPIPGTGPRAAAPGKAMGPKRAPPPRSGVWPPSRNQAKPSTAVSPDTVMLSAMPETTWLPRCVTHAKPCTNPTSTDAAIPAPRPAQAEPVTAAVAAAAKAAASILPSSPMSTTPDRSENNPPSAASTSGAAPRTVAAARSATTTPASLIDGALAWPWLLRRVHGPPEQCFDRAPEPVLEGAADEDDQPLDDHDDVARQRRDVERQLRPALVQRAEQDRSKHDPRRVIAAHERHRDADIPCPADEVEEQAMLHAHDLVQAHQPRERAGDRHGHDHRARGPDASVHGGRLAVAEGPELVSPARVPDIEPHEGAGGQGQDRREVQRRATDLPAKHPGHLVELGQPGARGELPRLRRLLAGLDQPVDEEIGHQRRGDEIEHDRRDDDVAAAPGLEPGRYECPRGAEHGRGGNGHRDDERRRPAAGPEAEEPHAEPAEVGLPLSPDVEERAVKRDRHREAREGEARRVVQGVPDRFAAAKGA